MADIAHHRLINYQPSTIAPQLVATLGRWRRRSRERAQLAHLSERELRDIGVSRAIRYNELSKPFWRA